MAQEAYKEEQYKVLDDIREQGNDQERILTFEFKKKATYVESNHKDQSDNGSPKH